MTNDGEKGSEDLLYAGLNTEGAVAFDYIHFMSSFNDVLQCDMKSLEGEASKSGRTTGHPFKGIGTITQDNE